MTKVFFFSMIKGMDFTHFTAGKDDSDRRIDKILRRFLSEENLSSLYKSLRKGLIKVNGKKCEGNFRVSEGDDIVIADFLLGKREISPLTPFGRNDKENHNARNDSEKKSDNDKLDEITILKNEYIFFLNKPYDIPVQPSSSSNGKSLAQIVQKEYEDLHEKTSLSFRTGPLHRLDRKTTGLIAFSQNLEGAKWFSEAIKNHTVQKFYLAILEGKLPEKQVWEEKIEKLGVRNEKLAISSEQFAIGREILRYAQNNKVDRGFHTVEVNSDSGKAAYTEVLPVSYGIFNGKAVTLARILIKTGRTHQIRAQSAFHKFPLLGDTAYGGTKIDSKRYGQDFFLHASELHIPEDNPLNLPAVMTAPIPEKFKKFLEIVKIDFSTSK